MPRKKFITHTLAKLFLASACFWVPMLIFIEIADEVHEKEPLFGDIAILQAIHQVSSPALDTVAVAITTLGSAPVVIVSVLVAAAVLAYKRHRRESLFLLFSAGGTGVINYILKVVFQRERPALWDRIVIENHYSFPSGHAMISSALALCVILLCWHTRYRWIAVIIGVLYMVLVSVSRLYLGVHFPSDIAAGWCVSLLWVLTLHAVVTRHGHQKLFADSEKSDVK